MTDILYWKSCNAQYKVYLDLEDENRLKMYQKLPIQGTFVSCDTDAYRYLCQVHIVHRHVPSTGKLMEVLIPATTTITDSLPG